MQAAASPLPGIPILWSGRLAMSVISAAPPGPSCHPSRRRAVADELERWVRQLPTWDLAQPEPWKIHLERSRSSQGLLAIRLRRLPSCSLTMADDGQEARLSLAGLEVRSGHGLDGACRRDRKSQDAGGHS